MSEHETPPDRDASPPDHADEQGPPDHAGEQGPPEHADPPGRDEDFEPGFDLEDTQVPDDPQIVDVPGLGEARAYYASEEVAEQIRDGGSTDLGHAEIAAIFREHYLSPSFEDCDAAKVENMHLGMTDGLLSAIAPFVSINATQQGADVTPPTAGDGGN